HLRELLADANFDTQIAELGLGTRAANALDTANIITVEDLLTMPSRRLMRLRGVGTKTRREIFSAVRILRERLGTPGEGAAVPAEEIEPAPETVYANNLSIDLIAQRILRLNPRERATVHRILILFLGLDPELPDQWPSQADVARVVDVQRA